MCNPFGGGGNKAAQQAAAEQRRREEQRRRNINTGMASIDQALSGFDDEFFSGRETAFIENATPSLDEDFREAEKQLIFALSRGGLLRSTEAANRIRKLNSERAAFERDITSAGADFANQGRRGLETTRGIVTGKQK